MSDSAAMGEFTGRYFIYDDWNTKLVTTKPDHDEYHVWTETGPDEDGEMWYVSDDPDGYWLDAEEFGPFEESDVLTLDQLKELGLR